MANNWDKHINCLIRFDYYNTSHHALCVARESDEKLVCYRVKEKSTIKSSGEIILEDEQGNNLGYVVDCRCKFRIPVGCARKLILRCEKAFVERVNECYRTMESLDVAIKRYNALKSQYYHASSDESKSVRNEINELAEEINARKADFLRKKSTKKKKSGKYENFKQLPNKNGISRVYAGGSCSSK